MRGRWFIVSAPSGAGKTSLVETAIPIVCKRHWLEQVITYTSKQPRSTDPERRDFHFVDSSEFERLIKEDFFLEWSDAHGAYYGTPKSVLGNMQKGESFILVIDRVGTQQIIKKIDDAVLIWIQVPDFQILRERLLARGRESMSQIDQRLRRAQIEIDLEDENPLYTHYIMNDHFMSAADKLVSIILNELGQKQGSICGRRGMVEMLRLLWSSVGCKKVKKVFKKH